MNCVYWTVIRGLVYLDKNIIHRSIYPSLDEEWDALSVNPEVRFHTVATDVCFYHLHLCKNKHSSGRQAYTPVEVSLDETCRVNMLAEPQFYCAFYSVHLNVSLITPFFVWVLEIYFQNTFFIYIWIYTMWRYSLFSILWKLPPLLRGGEMRIGACNNFDRLMDERTKHSDFYYSSMSDVLLWWVKVSITHRPIQDKSEHLIHPDLIHTYHIPV